MKFSVVTPVYNDWDSLNILITEIIEISKSNDFDLVKIIVVNDGSSLKPINSLSQFNKLEIVNLATNMGHQRAICVGLCYANEKLDDSENIIVMDSDGEDKPSDIPKLLNQSISQNSPVIFAKRAKRSEGVTFKLYYILYKFLFNFLTGDNIRFGNFCVIKKRFIDNIVSNPDSWNHFSGSILKSKLD